MDTLAGVTQEEGHTGCIHLPSAVPALLFFPRRFHPSLHPVDREVDVVCVYPRINSSPLGHDFVFTRVLTSECFGVYELNHQGDRLIYASRS